MDVVRPLAVVLQAVVAPLIHEAEVVGLIEGVVVGLIEAVVVGLTFEAEEALLVGASAVALGNREGKLST